MGSLKALQEWCRVQCEGYSRVDVRDMSASFRNGLAFCAIIHRHRPDLIDFDSLSEENVYENNRLAFEVAESQLGIPALLDPEDMVSMKVPDRLSIITYVSQYYNFFNNRSTANPPSMKRLAPAGQNEPAMKRPLAPADGKAAETESVQPAQTGAETAAKRSTLSSTCSACNKHVHLVQRFLVDGKLYHRNCFRCTKCHSTLLPGSYKLETDLGALVCSHHLSKQTTPSQNGTSEVGKKAVQPARTGDSTSSNTAPNTEKEQDETPPSEEQSQDPVRAAPAEVEEKPSEADSHRESEEEKSRPSSPPNPFDESDEEETQSATEEEPHTPVPAMTNGDDPSTPENPLETSSRPVPAPRRVSEVAPPPRPAPRARLSQRAGTVGEHQKPPTPPKPRERSESPASGSHKPKDPPWLVLVQSEQKRKKAPPPPPPGPATPSNTSLGEEGSSRPSSPSDPSNPFEEDDDDDDENKGNEEEEGEEGGAVPPSVSVNHPWYRIRQAADLGEGETRPSRSTSPGSAKSKKRPAPRAPKLPARTPGCPHSQASSCSPSPALSTESLSSCSDHNSSLLPLGGSATSSQEQSFTKSVSEPSIVLSGDASSSSSSADSQHAANTSAHSTSVPANASSAPTTPQSKRSTDSQRPKAPPPRPPTTPSPLVTHSPKKICKENPFNRKASPSPAKTPTRPPRGPRPARPPAPGYGFPLIKRKVQSDDYIPVEDIHGEMAQLEKQLDELEQRGVELEKKLRSNPNDEDEEHLLVDWFTLIHDKHLLVRREAELVYTAKQQNLEERQADVEYELRCLLNKPEKDWTEEDKSRELELMADLVTIIEQRNQIVNSMDQDRQRDEEEDKLMQAMLKKKDFHRDPDTSDQHKKKGAKFKPIKALKLLSHKKEKS